MDFSAAINELLYNKSAVAFYGSFKQQVLDES